MGITLTRQQMDWLDARVASGEFASVEEAVRHLLDDLMAGSIEDDDLDWTRPLLDEARESVGRGDVVSLEEHRAHTAALLDRLGAR